MCSVNETTASGTGRDKCDVLVNHMYAKNLSMTMSISRDHDTRRTRGAGGRQEELYEESMRSSEEEQSGVRYGGGPMRGRRSEEEQ